MAAIGRKFFKNVFRYTKDACVTSGINGRFLSSEVSDIPYNQEAWPKKKKEFRRLKAEKYMQNRQDPKIERAARLGHLRVSLDTVRREWYAKHGAEDTVKLARHYGIYEHVFGGMEFSPSVEMKVHFGEDCEVYKGNFITPTQASCQPTFDFDSEPSGLWTVLITNPDGNIFKENMELLHYLVINISGNDVSSGHTVCQYLAPVPPKGTGYHRVVCCLMRQSQEIDTNNYKEMFSRRFSRRSFSTPEFLSSSKVVPVAIKFFQTSWDESVSQTYTENLGMTPPCYETRPFITPSRKRTLSTRETFELKYRNT